MTIKETRDYFEQMVMGNGLYPLQPICQKDMEMTKIALNALEKQIPKKVKVEKYDIGGNDYFCPCGCKIQSGQYCRDCGQALDLGDSM